MFLSCGGTLEFSSIVSCRGASNYNFLKNELKSVLLEIFSRDILVANINKNSIAHLFWQFASLIAGYSRDILYIYIWMTLLRHQGFNCFMQRRVLIKMQALAADGHTHNQRIMRSHQSSHKLPAPRDLEKNSTLSLCHPLPCTQFISFIGCFMFVPHLFPMTVFTLTVAAVKMCVSYRDGSIRLGGLREAL